jgi:carbon storage regulator
MLSEASRVPAAPASRPPTATLAPAEGRTLPGSTGNGPATKKPGGLVLTRHLGESIMIGEDVEVEVVGLKSGTVRLKLVAPRSVPVHRREVFDAIRSDQVGADVTTPPGPVAPRPGKPQGGLVLARHAEQSIMIGEEIEIGVVEVRPATVKLRIAAPRTVSVHRREVFDAIRGEQA